MNVRGLKLAIATENECDAVKSLNKFFDDSFKDVKIYIQDKTTDLIFMKGDKCIMKMDLECGYLWCIPDNLWQVLQDSYHCTYIETREIILYKVVEYFNIESLTPLQIMR